MLLTQQTKKRRGSTANVDRRRRNEIAFEHATHEHKHQPTGSFRSNQPSTKKNMRLVTSITAKSTMC